MSNKTPMTWPGCGAGFVRADEASPVQGAASASGERIVVHNFSGMITNCIAAATTEKRKEFIAALLAAIQYEIDAAASSASGAKGAAVKPWQERAKDAGDFLVFSGETAAKYMEAEIAGWRAWGAALAEQQKK